jgi:hypothetical protein
LLLLFEKFVAVSLSGSAISACNDSACSQTQTATNIVYCFEYNVEELNLTS